MPSRFEDENVNERVNCDGGRVLVEWREAGGVLLLGYEMYRLLTTKQVPRRPGKRPDTVIDITKLDYNRELQKGECPVTLIHVHLIACMNLAVTTRVYSICSWTAPCSCSFL